MNDEFWIGLATGLLISSVIWFLLLMVGMPLLL